MVAYWFLLLFRIPLSDFPSIPIHFYLYQKRSPYQTWSVLLLRKNEQVGHITWNTDGFSLIINNNQYSKLLLHVFVQGIFGGIKASSQLVSNVIKCWGKQIPTFSPPSFPPLPLTLSYFNFFKGGGGVWGGGAEKRGLGKKFVSWVLSATCKSCLKYDR